MLWLFAGLCAICWYVFVLFGRVGLVCRGYLYASILCKCHHVIGTVKSQVQLCLCTNAVSWVPLTATVGDFLRVQCIVRLVLICTGFVAVGVLERCFSVKLQWLTLFSSSWYSVPGFWSVCVLEKALGLYGLAVS